MRAKYWWLESEQFGSRKMKIVSLIVEFFSHRRNT